MGRLSASIAVVLVLASGVPGCFDNVSTLFPPGLEPFEPNLAPAPTPVEGDPCPETITFARPPDWRRSLNVHARACIHAPPSVVWAAIQNPQTGRDPSSSSPPFMVLAPMAGECDGLYETQVHVDDIVDVDFRNCWRHEVIEGTEDDPLLTATRWQKVWGTTVITTLEGSIVSRPHADDPAITELEYEYHLDATLGSHDRIESYLRAIYGRMRDDAHGVPLLPADF